MTRKSSTARKRRGAQQQQQQQPDLPTGSSSSQKGEIGAVDSKDDPPPQRQPQPQQQDGRGASSTQVMKEQTNKQGNGGTPGVDAPSTGSTAAELDRPKKKKRKKKSHKCERNEESSSGETNSERVEIGTDTNRVKEQGSSRGGFSAGNYDAPSKLPPSNETTSRKRQRPGEDKAEERKTQAKELKSVTQQQSTKGNSSTNTAAAMNPSSKPLQGLVLAISVTTNKNTDDKKRAKQESGWSYRNAAAHCQTLGATVSSQITKKVTALVASDEAVSQATQRVRKAMKKGKPIVSLKWLEACAQQGKRVNMQPFSLMEWAAAAIQVYDENKQGANAKAKTAEEEDEDDDDPNAGWTEAVSLGCCCVCHEMGTTADCEWCKGKSCESGGSGG